MTLSRRAVLSCGALACGALAALPVPAAAWGFSAHRLVHERALDALPKGLRAAFSPNAAWLVEHAVDADLDRASPDDPDHFLNVDLFGAYPFAEVPASEAEHLRRHGAAARTGGRVPWRAAEVHAELVAAFRARDLRRALDRAAQLGHFVADAHVPLHATKNHDGQETGQHGIHSRWESALVARYREQLEPRVHAAAPRPVDDPAAAVLDAVRESALHVDALLAADRAAVAGLRDRPDTPEDERYADEYDSRLFARESARLAARLSAAASAVAAMWTDAWEDAGRPDLPVRRIPYVRNTTRAILASLDGGAADVFDDAVARGVMPELLALRRRGATGRSVSAIPTKTAPGHAALFTGAWPDRNGIAGNEVQVPDATVLDTMTGYSSVPLTAEPVWFTAGRQDLEVVVAAATQAHPCSTFFEERRFRGWAPGVTIVDGYQSIEADGEVYTASGAKAGPAGRWTGLPPHHGAPREIALDVSGSPVFALALDDAADPAAGYDTLLLAADRDAPSAAVLKPGPPRDDAEAFATAAIPVAGGRAAVFFRLFEMAPDLSSFVLFRTAPHMIRSNRAPLEASLLEETGGFAGNGGSWSYERGQLGPPLWKGGDGTAERRYLETVALVARQFTRLTTRMAARGRWDLLLTYLPYPDEALHAWHGHMDPALPGHDPRVAARLRPFVDAMLRIVDGYVGMLARLAEKEGAVLAVATDHGMTSANRVFRPNVALAGAGLLALSPEGEADLARTRAVYFPGNSGYVLLNRASRPGGIVRPDQETAVRREIEQALRAVRDPATGRPVVTDVIDPSRPGARAGIGGPRGGDLYLVVAPGYDLNARPSGEVVEGQARRGTHFQEPQEPAMHGAFTIAGPGVAAGADLGVIRQIDVAPTLSALLGIDPPAQSTGTVLTKALAERP